MQGVLRMINRFALILCCYEAKATLLQWCLIMTYKLQECFTSEEGKTSRSSASSHFHICLNLDARRWNGESWFSSALSRGRETFPQHSTPSRRRKIVARKRFYAIKGKEKTFSGVSDKFISSLSTFLRAFHPQRQRCKCFVWRLRCGSRRNGNKFSMLNN